MSGVTPLVDTLLATRLGQRVDLVPLKAQVEIAGPGAVANVEKITNDVRLPSREALQRELGVGLAGRDGAAPDFAQARTGAGVTLSAAARTVSAILNLPVGTSPSIRGRAPLQPDMRPPAVPVLTATLARTVAESGLFYESHLQHYAAGQRTLAQLAREPQAGLASPAAGAPARDAGLPLPAAALHTALAVPPGQAAAPPLAPLVPLDAAPELDVLATPDAPKLAASPAAGMAAPDAGGDPAPPSGNPPASPAAVAGPLEPAAAATTYGRTGLPDPAQPSPHDFSLQDSGAPAEAASGHAARAGHPAAAIHPDLVGLVRQQLEMLALPVFRWSGEGWPGVPMDWEIRQRQERDEPEAREGRDGREGREGHAGDDGVQTVPSAWTTRMTLKFPRLGTVDVRLGLAGAALQLRLNASQAGTVTVLNQACEDLSRRFGAVGLELTDLQIGGAVPRAAAAEPAGGHDAG